jgi:hypothetical protein
MIGRRKNEGGFALLLVFVLAAAIAISFYMALPRATFEAQRRKEQLLVDRGQEYVTAIRHYYRKFQRFPAKIEDLENTNNMRFLRKRYADPITGKDDWRLIHAGPGGVLLDSLVQKPGAPTGMPGAPGQNPNQPNGQDQNALAQNGFAPAATGAPQPADGSQNNVNPGLARRPSDRAPGAAPADARFDPNGNPLDDPNNALNPQDLQPPGSEIPPYPAAGFPNGPPVAGQTGTPGYPTDATQNPNGAPQPAMGQPGFPAQAGQSPFGAVQPGIPGAPPSVPGIPNMQSGSYQQAGALPRTQAAAFNPALAQIQGQLTSPSTSNSPFGTSNSPFGGGPATGGGIVGVASKSTQRGIREFDKHRKYSEWEFIFDMKKLNGLPGQAPQLQNVPGMNPNGQNNSNNPFSQTAQPATPQPSTNPSPFPTTPNMPPTTVGPN